MFGSRSFRIPSEAEMLTDSFPLGGLEPGGLVVWIGTTNPPTKGSLKTKALTKKKDVASAFLQPGFGWIVCARAWNDLRARG